MKTRGAGDRRHRITLFKRTVTTTDLESVPTYTPKLQRWAAIEPLSVRELLIREDSQNFSEVTHKITMLWTPGFGHQDQIRFGSRVFEIQGEPINREELNREMILMCIERK